MRKNIIFVLAIFLILGSVASVVADGGYFPHPGYWVRPGQQKAVIFHEDNTENMILTSNFQGDAKDLVWIIPTPTRPEITKANEKVFTNVQKLVKPQYQYRFEYQTFGKAATAGMEDVGVVVIESKKVDYYDVNVLLATNSQDLIKWFNDNDYDYPEDYAHVLNYYINKGWYFTAIKVSPESEGATEVIQDLKEGHPTPVKLVFLTEKVVYPLKISSIDFSGGFKISPNLELNRAAISHLEDLGYDELAEKETAVEAFNQIIADAVSDVKYEDSIANSYSIIIPKSNYNNLKNQYCNYDSCIRSNLENVFMSYFSRSGVNLYPNYRSYTPIYLYVISDGKYEADNFYIQYGNWVKKKQIEDLGDDENGNPYIQPEKRKYYLTYLSASLQKSQMDDDIFLKKADNNKKVNAGPENWQIFIYGLLIGFVLFLTWVFTPLGIMFIAGSLILFFSKSKSAGIFGWIIEIFSLLITFLAGSVFFMIALFNNSAGNYIVVSVLISWLLLLGIMILLIVLQVKHRKQNVANLRK